MSAYRIGDAAQLACMSADTLRYYERIGLMRRVLRDGGGRRAYTETDLERLRFIARAQAMDFSLAEIRQLLELRDHPATARAEARRLAHGKLDAVTQRLRTLRHLHDELRLLLNLCTRVDGSCPILAMESTSQTTPPAPDRARKTALTRRRS